MKITVDQFVEGNVAEMAGVGVDLERLVIVPSGLDAVGMLAALGDPRVGRMGIPLMADFMAPQGSIYYDAIFGAYHGQLAIRNWLVPAMAEIEFVDFVPTAEPALFDDGQGGTSLDEWNMVANIGDDVIPLARGVSVRRYREGWITWACDVYDTGSMRQPPPPEAGIEAPPLPPWPRVDWTVDDSVTAASSTEATGAWLAAQAAARAADGPAAVVETPSGLSHQEMSDVLAKPILGTDTAAASGLFHPTESVYFDPLVGELRGQAAVGGLLDDVVAKVGHVVFEPLGPRLFDGTTSVQEWKQMAIMPDGSRVMMLRGTSVRRFSDGWAVYAADYFDTAPLGDDDVRAAARAAGVTLTSADLAKHRLG